MAVFTEGNLPEFDFNSVEVILTPASPTVTPALDEATVYDTSNNIVGNTIKDGPEGSFAAEPEVEYILDVDQPVELFEFETINVASMRITTDTLAEQVSRTNSLPACGLC